MPNPPPHRRPHRDDLAIAAAGLVGGLLLWSFGLYNSPALERGPLVLLPLLAMCAAEVMRRTAQPWALLLACAALAGDQMTGSLLVTVLMFTDVVYAAVMYGPPRTVRAVPVVSVTVTVAGTLTVLAALRTPVALLLGVTLGLVTIGPAFTGVVTRTHRDAAAAERLRADQTRLLAEVDRVQAVTAERNRVARELHDVIANHLSAAALHSTAALAGDDPAADRAALRVVRENATQGLTEMRRLIGLLREGVTDDPAPSPSLDGLTALVERTNAAGARAGLRVTVRNDRATARPLPAPVELAAYRILQESLANALKYAAPGEVAVHLAQRDDTLSLAVTSPHGHHATTAVVPPPGTGTGLLGMTERAALLGGTLTAGPGRGGRWEVRAALPLTVPVPPAVQEPLP